ncbi:MAG TPA: polymer-forming cytoskeletal protein [Pyrinomonadaceae bacterium]|nr:polymer-forming cytoskeletal protein [Pyrinomonadaceae bacterium]
MLRMGKNAKEAESDQTADSQTTQFNTSRYTSSYQNPEPQYRPQAETASASRAVTESESLARDIKEGLLSGFVGNGTSLTGEASFKGMLRVDGHLSGHVKSEGGTLIVGNNGQVDADIEVAVATIHGSVNGDITASQRLELGRAAKVNGNITTPSLVIEQGAVFEGNCKMVQQKAAAEKQREDRSLSAAAGADSLDTSSMQPVSDSASETSDYSDVSEVAS